MPEKPPTKRLLTPEDLHRLRTGRIVSTAGGAMKAPQSSPRQHPGICPRLIRTCCGQPNLCGLTGAEIDPGICQRCQRRQRMDPGAGGKRSR